MARAEDRLREWRVMLPASSTLERLITAEVTHVKSLLCLTPLICDINNKINAISLSVGVIHGGDFTSDKAPCIGISS